MDDTDLYEWGERPDDTNFIAPMVVAQDPALSMRAKGLMFYLLALPKGARTDSKSLAAAVKEGRDAVRVALNELEAAGYIVRTRRKTATGFIGITKLRPYGTGGPRAYRPTLGTLQRARKVPAQRFQGLDSQASNESGSEVQGLDCQAPENPALKSRGLKTQAPENPASSPKERVPSVESGAAATTHYENQEPQNHVQSARAEDLDRHVTAGEDGASTGAAVTGSHNIPWTMTHLLQTWFGVNGPEQQQAWTSAWATALATNEGTGYDVEADLSAYLSRCREEKREAKASRWLKFLIEDRVKWRTTQQHHADVMEQRDSADGGEGWALRSLRQTPRWNVEGSQ